MSVDKGDIIVNRKKNDNLNRSDSNQMQLERNMVRDIQI